MSWIIFEKAVGFILSSCNSGSGGGEETTVTSTSPIFTSGSTINVNENTTATGYTAVAIDTDGDTVTYDLTGGSDQAAFNLDANSGVLSFLVASDFEQSADSDKNNTYTVEITATDGANSVVQNVTVTVLDVNEMTSRPVHPFQGEELITWFNSLK